MNKCHGEQDCCTDCGKMPESLFWSSLGADAGEAPFWEIARSYDALRGADSEFERTQLARSYASFIKEFVYE